MNIGAVEVLLQGWHLKMTIVEVGKECHVRLSMDVMAWARDERIHGLAMNEDGA